MFKFIHLSHSKNDFHPLSFSKSDIAIGGLLPNLSTTSPLAISRTYIQDDLTWCIQKSKNLPMIINVFAAASLETWLFMIFVVAYLGGSIMYLMLPFELENKHRNHRDWHYMIIQVTLPAIIGMNQRFQPKSCLLRIFYGFLLITMELAWQTFFLLGLRFFHDPIQRHQISTIDEIVYNDFRLSGTVTVQRFIPLDARVSIILCFIPIEQEINRN